MRVVRVDHMVWGAGLGVHTVFLFPTSESSNLRRSGRCCRLPPCITRRNFVNRLGTWNVRRINGTAKRKEVVDVCREGKFEFFAFDGDEIEREWRRIMVWSKCHHYWCSGDVWRSAVINFGCVCSRILWTKFTFSRVKVYVVVWYGDEE